MQKVMLIIDTTEEEYGTMLSFDTVAEAQERAAEIDGKVFDIFTLYYKGEKAAIDWKLQADHATNLRENKKAKSKGPTKGMRSGTWSALELQTLEQSVKAGISVKDIAKALNRTYNSCYLKTRVFLSRK